MTPTQPPGWFTGRTRLITIVSIVAVGLAGATAVSANMGILDAASDSDVGTVSAAGDLITTTMPPTQVIDVYLPGESTSTTATTVTTLATPAPAAAGAGVQEFAVDVAGTVAVATTDTGLRLERVSPAAGWSWTLTQTGPTQLMVTMTNGARTLEFMAATTADGIIAANVNEPIVTPAPAPTVATGNSGGGSYDDDENEHEGDEHEGEYEGGEDDD